MPKDTYWFKHDATARTDLKIKTLLAKYGWEGYGWYWLTIELLRSEDNYKLPYDEDTFEALALDMNCPTEKAQEYIDYLVKKKLLSLNGDKQFYSARLLRDMAAKDQIREQAREAVTLRWEKARQPVIDLPDLAPYVEELRPQYPNLDLDNELVKFNKHWSQPGKELKRPRSALKNWLDKAGKPYSPPAPRKKVEEKINYIYEDGRSRRYFIDPTGMKNYDGAYSPPEGL